MLQVSYVSQTSEPMSPSALLDLLLECRSKNEKRGVTGMLLYGNSTFLQVIEGEDDVIDSLVSRIEADPRHDRIQTLHRRSIKEREYGDWSMGFEQVANEDLSGVDGLANFAPDDFTLDYLSDHGPVVDSLLQHYRQPHWDQVIGELDAKDRVIKRLDKALNQVSDQARIARLALESVTDAAKSGENTENLLRLCESTLESMRKR